MDYPWIIKQLALAAVGTIVGYAIGKLAKKTLKNNEEKKQDGEQIDCHIALMINSSLKMGKGKVAAQCGHSVVALMKQTRKVSPHLYEACARGACRMQLYAVDSSDDFKRLKVAANQLSLTNYVVADAGRTQIASGSLTVLGVGPASADVIKQIVAGLPTYK
ncbi:hypothetical protein LSTR_LSTR008305 [Laodelphax striatellus]|uniref:peptidyl-tRNA hydrolase n=1 Tax=Laodelphax striatellus TaxID=195883 RepID=A0A482XKV8_LAOST|nr:hypothetical protein LSTR_LSTR008305 [Laodelphax striatellus]